MTAVLEALIRAAAGATAAGAACVLASSGDDELVVVAAAGDTGASIRGRRISSEGSSAGFVLASAQPMALSLRPGEAGSSTLAALLERQPASVLSVPCTSDDEVAGVLELIDKAGGPFTIDDIELLTLLAGIAGAALLESASAPPAIPEPSQLSAELARLAHLDPDRYSIVAGVVALLLGHV